mgnify:CR=1 FL=1
MFHSLLSYNKQRTGNNDSGLNVIYDNIKDGMQNKVQNFNNHYFDTHITEDFQEIMLLYKESDEPKHPALLEYFNALVPQYLEDQNLLRLPN